MVIRRSFFVAVMLGVAGSVWGAGLSLQKPFGMAFDAHGQLYIAEIEGNDILVLDRAYHEVKRVTAIGGYGKLERPFDIKVCGGRYYILDTGHSNVVVADGDWQLVYQIGVGHAGSGPGEFSEPHFLAVDEAGGRLYVTDTLNSRVQYFDLGSGRFLGQWLGTDAGGELAINRPTGIAVLDGGERVVLAEYGSHGPMILDREGKVVKELRGYGAAYAVHADGERIYVVSTYNNTVAVYGHDGAFLLRLYSRLDSAAEGELNKPAGVISDGKGNILVTEWRNNRLQVFSGEGAFVAAYGAGFSAAEQSLDFAKRRRLKPSEPVILAAFTRVLGEGAIKRYYDSGIRKLYIQPGEDLENPAVKRCVDTAHSLGMRVDIVFDVYHYGARVCKRRGTADGKSALANAHPEYYTLKRDGKTRNEGMLSYVYPAVRAFKAEAFCRAVSWSGADGAALDYIRWPAGNSDGYDGPAVAAFEAKYGVSPFEVEPTDRRWCKFRAGYITKFICELRAELANLDRDVELSVIVDSDPEWEMIQVSRDWATWAKMGIIDHIGQMIYTDHYDVLYEGVRVGRKYADRYGLKVSAWIDCYLGYLYTNQLIRDGAWVAQLAGADEVVVVRDGTIERLDLFGGFEMIRRDFDLETRGEMREVVGGGEGL